MATVGNDPESGKHLAFRTQAQERISADKLSLFIFFFCILAISGQAALIAVSLHKLPPQIPFYYLRPWGNQMLAPAYAIFILPALSLIFFVVNYFLAFFAVRDNFFLLRVLVIFSAIVSLAALWDVSKIVTLLI